MTNLQHSHAAAGIIAIVGIVLGLWSASSYVAAFMRASNAIYDVPEGRPVWKTDPSASASPCCVIVLLAAAVIVVVHRRPRAPRRAGDRSARRGSTAVTAWDIAKWPVLLIIFGLMLAVLYWASPNAKHGSGGSAPAA